MELDPKEFPANSKKSKEPAVEAKQIEQVVTTGVTEKKRSLGKKLSETFFGGDFQSAARFVTTDVLLPAVRNLFVEATTRGIERVIYGDRAPTRQTPMQPMFGQGHTKYNYTPQSQSSVMMPKQPPHRTQPSPTRKADEIMFQSREQAELILENMSNVLDKYGAVSIADLCAMVGFPSTYVDNNWGWTRLGHSAIRQTRNGWLLDLPPVETLFQQ